MKAKYKKDADLLEIRLSKKHYEYAKQEGDFIVHYSKQNQPVLIEILNATEFLKNTNKSLPKEIQKQVSTFA